MCKMKFFFGAKSLVKDTANNPTIQWNKCLNQRWIKPKESIQACGLQCLCAAGFNFKIINNFKAEQISASVHKYCDSRTDRKGKLKGLDNWGIISSLFYRLFLSFLCLLHSNYIRMVFSFVFLAISSETCCQ